MHCTCLVKKKADGTPYKLGTRDHLGMPPLLSKKFQVAFSTIIRCTKGEAARTGKTVRETAIAKVEEMYNHFQNVASARALRAPDARRGHTRSLGIAGATRTHGRGAHDDPEAVVRARPVPAGAHL